MSIGNSTQAIDFNRNDLTLVIGENLDQGGEDGGARNGTGKTTIINALSYALFGQALTKIKVNNLINKTNAKGMVVAVDFSKDGINFRVERGRKPNFLRFYIEGEEQLADDESQGDSRETQAELEKLMSMSHDMFKHVLALNTYSEPFLSMRANDQRQIIEQLLGITLLSEKADVLKKELKETKDDIKSEEIRIKTVTESNNKIQETITNLERRQREWKKTHAEKLDDLANKLEDLSHVDIEAELKAHDQLAAFLTSTTEYKELEKLHGQLLKEVVSNTREMESAKRNQALALDKKCPTCEQGLHDEKHETLIKDANHALESAVKTEKRLADELDKLEALMTEKKVTGTKPVTFYKELHEAHNHNSTLTYLTEQIESHTKEEDPYDEQIIELKNEALTEISYDEINKLANMRDHQDFLLKLLTNKDSYIRKRIIDQNLSFLNSRLGYYLDKIGLPHLVEFKNDLNVEISEFGRDLDFDNLSRGERNRLILSLSWAFRDVWENLYQPVNLLFIDELIDSGMDSIGVDNSLAILKTIARERKKSVWLVSHKDDLALRVNNVLTVTKENGYTTYGNDVDIV